MNFINNQHEDAPPGAAQSHEQQMVEKSIADALAARVAELEKENANLHECYEYTKAGDYFQAAAIDLLSHMREHIDEQGKFRGNSQWRLNEVAEAILELEKANKERLAAASTSEEKRPLLIKENEQLSAHLNELQSRYLAECERQDKQFWEIEQLTTELAAARAERDEAIELLAEWCVRVELVGTGWDDWDEGYKNAMYRPTRTPELRAALDAAIEKAKQKMKGEA